MRLNNLLWISLLVAVFSFPYFAHASSTQASNEKERLISRNERADPMTISDRKLGFIITAIAIVSFMLAMNILTFEEHQYLTGAILCAILFVLIILTFYAYHRIFGCALISRILLH